MSGSGKQIKALTGIRGIAALFVVIYHYHIFLEYPDPIGTFFNHGYLSVDLFFVLSGFVMSMTYGRLFVNGFTWPAFATFMGRRFARVYPLYIFVTLLVIFMMAFFSVEYGVKEVPLTWSNILSHILMVQAWGVSKSFVGPAWSISTEWAAYLVFPLLAYLALYKSAMLAAIMGIISFFVLSPWGLQSFYTGFRGVLDFSDGAELSPLIRCICGFSLGMLAYRVATEWDAGTAFLRKNASALLLTGALFILLLIPRTDIAIVALFPLLIISISTDDNKVAKFIGWSPVYGLGVISYSLYMVHIICLWINPQLIEMMKETGVPHAYTVAMMLQIVVSLIVATVTYFCIEKPGRAIIQKMISAKK